MNAESFLTAEEEDRVKSAIVQAEKLTTGEIRVHLSDRVQGDPLEHCQKIFNDLKMYKTAERNAVLIHIDVPDRSLVIWGDKGINEKVPEHFWQDVINSMVDYFKQDSYAEGIVEGVMAVGEKLQAFFPGRHDDSNELSNEISKGDS